MIRPRCVSPYGRHLQQLGLLMAVAAGAALYFAWRASPRGGYQADARTSNAIALWRERYGLDVQPTHVIWPAREASPSTLVPLEVYFLGRSRGARARDFYVGRVIASSKGVPVWASTPLSLSRTAVADEHALSFDGERYLAVASRVEGQPSLVTVYDLAGLSSRALEGLSGLQRWQQRVTSWQETGRLAGHDRLEVRLTSPQAIELRWQARRLQISDVGHTWQVAVDVEHGLVLGGPARATRARVGKRSFLPWAVDTVRNLSFIGPQKIAWLEDLVYGAVDKARRMSGAQVTAATIKDEMDLPLVREARTAIAGWPPPPLRPLLKPPLQGEGQWVEVEGPFLRRRHGAPSYFAMTFLRPPDRERLFARVYFVAWDPRRLDLRMVAGTQEPRSATGLRGQGLIPRDPALVRRLVAAFNGGFQSIHGDFGMAVADQVYAPAMPWAATVARLRDGATGLGTWDGEAAPGWVPPWIHSFRQNLTPLVEDGVFNPWRRGSWGGGTGFIGGGGPKAFIVRSGLCLHESGHLMFVMGDPVDGPLLGQTMHKAGCRYGLELDINRGHVGFEFFNVLGPEEALPPGATFKEQPYFARTGVYPGLEPLRFYMREVTRGTGNSPVPRWLGREAREFFYLIERELLPWPDLAPLGGQAKEGRWTSAALPAPALEFPPAMVRTFLAPTQAHRVHLVALDLRWIETTLCLPRRGAGCLAPSSGAPPLAVLPLGSFSGERQLWAEGKLLAGRAGKGGPPFLVLRQLRPEGPQLPTVAPEPARDPASLSIEGLPATRRAAGPLQFASALCVPEAAVDEGVLLYATGLALGEEELAAALERAGCARQNLVYLGGAQPLVLQQDSAFHGLLGESFAPLADSPSLLVRRAEAPWGTRIFTHVKPQPRSVWTAVQPERTRASALRHANLAAQALGLPPAKSVQEFCGPPYTNYPELRQYRWRNPRTGRVCGDAALEGKLPPRAKHSAKHRKRIRH